MSLENPISVLVNSDGVPVGTPTNVLYVSGSNVVTGSVALSQPAHVIIDSSSVLPVSGSLSVAAQKSSTAGVTSVPAITTSQAVLGVNTNRLGAIIVNDSPANAYLLFGSGSQFNSWTYRLYPQATIELNTPVYTGVISAIWTVATGSMRVTELT